MRKYFCDKCGHELSKENVATTETLTCLIPIEGEDIRYKTIRVNGGSDRESGIDMCKYCVIDAIVKQLDDRPKAAEG